MGTGFPFVSVLCPTCERQAFLPALLHMFHTQDYPADHLELIILDDSLQPSPVVMEAAKHDARIRYVHDTSRRHKRSIAAKRQQLNDMARGEILVCMDDDDYYPPCRVSHAVQRLTESKCGLAGCSRLPIYHLATGTFSQSGPFGPKHATHNTMAYTQTYASTHSYEQGRTFGEETAFTRRFTEPMVQLDPEKTVLCISHAKNTVPKVTAASSTQRGGSELLPLVPRALADVVHDPWLLEFYARLGKSLSESGPT